MPNSPFRDSRLDTCISSLMINICRWIKLDNFVIPEEIGPFGALSLVPWTVSLLFAAVSCNRRYWSVVKGTSAAGFVGASLKEAK